MQSECCVLINGESSMMLGAKGGGGGGGGAIFCKMNVCTYSAVCIKVWLGVRSLHMLSACFKISFCAIKISQKW